MGRWCSLPLAGRVPTAHYLLPIYVYAEQTSAIRRSRRVPVARSAFAVGRGGSPAVPVVEKELMVVRATGQYGAEDARGSCKGRPLTRYQKEILERINGRSTRTDASLPEDDRC